MGAETKAQGTGLVSCPKCTVGVLYVTTDTEETDSVRCFHCGYTDSRVKPGYEVLAPGEPITKVGDE
jgi:DNA-directed RNA polymerase subunit RPC12/RpoP